MLQHGLQLIMARYTRIINYRPCCNLYILPQKVTVLSTSMLPSMCWDARYKVPSHRSTSSTSFKYSTEAYSCHPCVYLLAESSRRISVYNMHMSDPSILVIRRAALRVGVTHRAERQTRRPASADRTARRQFQAVFPVITAVVFQLT